MDGDINTIEHVKTDCLFLFLLRTRQLRVYFKISFCFEALVSIKCIYVREVAYEGLNMSWNKFYYNIFIDEN